MTHLALFLLAVAVVLLGLDVGRAEEHAAKAARRAKARKESAQ